MACGVGQKDLTYERTEILKDTVGLRSFMLWSQFFSWDSRAFGSSQEAGRIVTMPLFCVGQQYLLLFRTNWKANKNNHLHVR
jgi:hypothetical protein